MLASRAVQRAFLQDSAQALPNTDPPPHSVEERVRALGYEDAE